MRQQAKSQPPVHLLSPHSRTFDPMINSFRFLLVLFFVSMQGVLMAQQLPVSVENLSDEQLMQLVSKYQLSGLSESDLEAKAKGYGLSTDQIMVLKKRMSMLEVGGDLSKSTYNNKTDSYVLRNKIYTKGPSIKPKDSTGTLKVFGSEIFDNEDMSFEPNLSIATPQGYILGVNDQLVIDVFGVSDITKKLKITTEGDIRFPNLGPIQVAGLTIEEARVRIKKSLAKIYPGITSGKVAVQISLGQIRSITVSLLGEVRRPGKYTVSALATLMNALYASGGPNDIGSFRNIELVRAGKTKVIFDLYNFLLRGDLGNNVLLQDEDVIRVAPYTKRVALKGAFKKPAIFDVNPGENAFDLLKYAGGFSDIAFRDLVRVTRIGAAHKEILTLRQEQLKDFSLSSGDTLTVDTLANIYSDRVMVTGSVYHPGVYGIQQIKTLRDLMQAVKPREQAYFERAMIRRYRSDYTPSLINFNINEVLSGKFNLDLVREDSVHIYERNELKEKYNVYINGEVNNQGSYEFYEGMTVQDLVLMAGGYRDGATRQKIEVSRRLRPDTGKDTAAYSVIKEIAFTDAAQAAGSDFSLQPFDIISVRRAPGYKEQINVSVEGEILYPGKYTLASGHERLSDIIQRAGGLKQNAFAQGAILVRKTFVGISQADASLVSTKANLINQPGGAGNSGVGTGIDSALVKKLENQQKPVGIRLQQALEHPGSIEDIFLEEGDVLKIPKAIQTIQTFGTVNAPRQIIYREGIGFREAVRESGGFALGASRRHSYVVYANGEVRSTRNFLFFHSYPAIKPGAEIYVPQRRSSRMSTGETIGLVSSLTSLLGLSVVLVNTLK
jgi:protein involved in polysaccharide export with SLBB domain